ncbi:hypothetical protein GC176_09800 [bacterium]|nr:hypothetical protein [bacterium]
MTDLLVRIPFSDDSDFSALALAPGLPMLDGRKLAYQVLLGWFGDLLAEPELGDDGVQFFIQNRGQRQEIAEHALATQRDLDGHLAGDFGRLKKALFDVRPVSPSERLIFNRLQPPISHFEGFLYRVRPVGSSDRLVWCWGFQRRSTDGELFLCPHAECSLLFVRRDTSIDTCPQCQRALFQQVAVERRSTFPAGALAATVVLSGLVGATYWIASVSGDEAVDTLPVLAAVSPPDLDETEQSDDAVASSTEPAGGRQPIGNEKPIDDASSTTANEARDNASASDELMNLQPLPDMPEDFERFAAIRECLSEPLRPFVATSEPRRLDLPTQGQGFDEPQLVDRVSPEERTGSVGANTSPQKSRPVPQQPALPEPAQSRPDATGAPSVTSSNAAADKLQQSAPRQPESVSQESTRRPEKSASNPSPVAESPGTESLASERPATAELASDWSTDYVAAYQQAIAERRFLIMLFRNPAGTPGDGVSLADLPTTADLGRLSETVRVVVPTTMPVPGLSSGTASRLLDHRSFRHLQGEAGVAIVDLTRTDSPNFGRVVSAFPGATDRTSIVAALKPAQSLPAGTISQRSLLLALRTSSENSAFADQTFDPQLNDLANRNSRYMAHLDQTGLFEADERRAAVRERFGENARLRELVFATDAATTIQSAASQAVEHWRSSGELSDNLRETDITAFGLELFQSPTTNHWFATLLIVTE